MDNNQISQSVLSQAFLERAEQTFKLSELETPEYTVENFQWFRLMLNIVVSDDVEIVTALKSNEVIYNSRCYEIVKVGENYYVFVKLNIPNDKSPMANSAEYVNLGENELGLPQHWWICFFNSQTFGDYYLVGSPSSFLAPVGADWHWVTGFHSVLGEKSVYLPVETKQVSPSMVNAIWFSKEITIG
jgi:hypothetical protein